MGVGEGSVEWNPFFLEKIAKKVKNWKIITWPPFSVEDINYGTPFLRQDPHLPYWKISGSLPLNIVHIQIQNPKLTKMILHSRSSCYHNGPDFIQAFQRKWWVILRSKGRPNLPLPLGCKRKGAWSWQKRCYWYTFKILNINCKHESKSLYMIWLYCLYLKTSLHCSWHHVPDHSCTEPIQVKEINHHLQVLSINTNLL